MKVLLSLFKTLYAKQSIHRRCPLPRSACHPKAAPHIRRGAGNRITTGSGLTEIHAAENYLVQPLSPTKPAYKMGFSTRPFLPVMPAQENK